jgi:hypothetical protein
MDAYEAHDSSLPVDRGFDFLTAVRGYWDASERAVVSVTTVSPAATNAQACEQPQNGQQI